MTIIGLWISELGVVELLASVNKTEVAGGCGATVFEVLQCTKG